MRPDFNYKEFALPAAIVFLALAILVHSFNSNSRYVMMSPGVKTVLDKKTGKTCHVYNGKQTCTDFAGAMTTYDVRGWIVLESKR